MPNKASFTWKPTDIVEVINASPENILLELDSGLLRLDAGRTLRLTASALEQQQLTALVNQGKVKVQPYKLRVTPRPLR